MADFTKCGKCSRCGNCCSNFLPLTLDEIKELKQLVKEDVEVQIKYGPGNRFVMMCPFLIFNNEDSTTRCSIYEHRPSICRLFRCDEPVTKLSAEESEKYMLVDMMREIVRYDYQKDAGMTYQQAMNFHLNKCREDRKKEKGD